MKRFAVVDSDGRFIKAHGDEEIAELWIDEGRRMIEFDDDEFFPVNIKFSWFEKQE